MPPKLSKFHPLRNSNKRNAAANGDQYRQTTLQLNDDDQGNHNIVGPVNNQHQILLDPQQNDEVIEVLPPPAQSTSNSFENNNVPPRRTIVSLGGQVMGNKNGNTRPSATSTTTNTKKKAANFYALKKRGGPSFWQQKRKKSTRNPNEKTNNNNSKGGTTTAVAGGSMDLIHDDGNAIAIGDDFTSRIWHYFVEEIPLLQLPDQFCCYNATAPEEDVVRLKMVDAPEDLVALLLMEQRAMMRLQIEQEQKETEIPTASSTLETSTDPPTENDKKEKGRGNASSSSIVGIIGGDQDIINNNSNAALVRQLVPISLDLMKLLSYCPELSPSLVDDPTQRFNLTIEEEFLNLSQLIHFILQNTILFLRTAAQSSSSSVQQRSNNPSHHHHHQDNTGDVLQMQLQYLQIITSNPGWNLGIRFTHLPSALQVDTNVHVNMHEGKLISLSGTIVKMTSKKLVPFIQFMKCPKCGCVCQVKTDPFHRVNGGGSQQFSTNENATLVANNNHKNSSPSSSPLASGSLMNTPVTTSTICSNEDCKGQMMSVIDQIWMDYVEARIQQKNSNSTSSSATGGGGNGGSGNRSRLPHSVLVTLEDELVDYVSVGQAVECVGIVGQRWKSLHFRGAPQMELVVHAKNIFRADCNQAWATTQQSSAVSPMPSQQSVRIESYNAYKLFSPEAFVASFMKSKDALRTSLIQSVCPQLFGMFAPRLGMLLSAVGGVALSGTAAGQMGKKNSKASGGHHGSKIRGNIHALLVGDPSTGKSQLLRFAALIAPRSVTTAGMTSTSAGLTVAATKEFGEWSLEPGALVLSDGGICVIDEIRTVSASDRTALHEAMEQQTISVAKAGMVTRLRTECSVIAACNPPSSSSRGFGKGKARDLVPEVGIAGPLLSRFDLVFLLWDDRDKDDYVASHILDYSVSAKIKSPLNQEELKCYVAFVREKYQPASLSMANTSGLGEGGATAYPQMDDEAVSLLARYYGAQRRRGRTPSFADCVPTTVRLLESLIRLTQAYTKVMNGHLCCAADAAVAILLMERSAHSLKIPLGGNVLEILGESNEAVELLGEFANNGATGNNQQKQKQQNSKFPRREESGNDSSLMEPLDKPLYSCSSILDHVFLCNKEAGYRMQNRVLSALIEKVGNMPLLEEIIEEEQEEEDTLRRNTEQELFNEERSQQMELGGERGRMKDNGLASDMMNEELYSSNPPISNIRKRKQQHHDVEAENEMIDHNSNATTTTTITQNYSRKNHHPTPKSYEKENKKIMLYADDEFGGGGTPGAGGFPLGIATYAEDGPDEDFHNNQRSPLAILSLAGVSASSSKATPQSSLSPSGSFQKLEPQQNSSSPLATAGGSNLPHHHRKKKSAEEIMAELQFKGFL